VLLLLLCTALAATITYLVRASVRQLTRAFPAAAAFGYPAKDSVQQLQPVPAPVPAVSLLLLLLVDVAVAGAGGGPATTAGMEGPAGRSKKEGMYKNIRRPSRGY
jgi:hypothetical protein